MTNEHRRQCRAALWHWQLLERQPTPENQCWAHALRQTAAYYQQQDPIRAGILEQRYRRHQTEQQVLDTLHIGRHHLPKSQRRPAQYPGRVCRQTGRAVSILPHLPHREAGPCFFRLRRSRGLAIPIPCPALRSTGPPPKTGIRTPLFRRTGT